MVGVHTGTTWSTPWVLLARNLASAVFLLNRPLFTATVLLRRFTRREVANSNWLSFRGHLISDPQKHCLIEFSCEWR